MAAVDPGGKVLCLGMAVADVIVKGSPVQNTDETAYVESISLHTGGDAVNQAAALAALGHTVHLVSCVGRDALGELLLRQCEAAGICVDACGISDEFPTACSVVSVGKQGKRTFLSVYRNAAREGWDAVDPDNTYSGDFSALSVGSLFFSQKLDDQVLTKLLKRAKDGQAVTFADMVSDRNNISLRDYRCALEKLDYAIPSQEEAVKFTGMRTADAAADVLLNLGVQNVVIKLGARGAFFKNREQRLLVRPLPVAVVDTTGAGDSFAAGLISAVLRGCATQEALKFAAATAAASVGAVGATVGIGSLRHVQSLLSQWECSVTIPEDIDI